MKATLGFFGFFGLLLAGLPATAQNSSKWKETGASINGASVFVKIDTIKNFRSVEFRNTVYKRADFSYSDLAGSTQRERFVFDCRGPRNLKYLPASDCHKKRPFGIVAANQKCASNVI